MNHIFIILILSSLQFYFQDMNLVDKNREFSYNSVEENNKQLGLLLNHNSLETDSAFLCKKFRTGNLVIKNISGEDIKVYITNLQVLVRHENKHEFRNQNFPYYPISNGKVLSLNYVKAGNYKVKIIYRKSATNIDKLIDIPLCENTLQLIDSSDK